MIRHGSEFRAQQHQHCRNVNCIYEKEIEVHWPVALVNLGLNTYQVIYALAAWYIYVLSS